MREVLDDHEDDVRDMHAYCTFDNDGDDIFKGWIAELRLNESGDEVFSTLGYGDDLEGLKADLRASGVTYIQVER